MAKTKGTKLEEWQKKAALGGICQKHLRFVPRLTVEHIIPVNLLQQMGLLDEAHNDEENFELWCKNCNGIKGGRIDVFIPKTISLLEKYIDILKERYGERD